MYCERCNIDFPENLRYCKWCGGALAERARSTGELHSCPACGAGVKQSWAFCRSCGAKITASVPAIAVCQHCGAVVDPVANNCGQCGKGLTGAIIAQPLAPPPEGVGAHCSNCGEKLDPGILYCKACGSPVYAGTAPFAASTVMCRTCEAYNPVGFSSCRVCGETLAEPVTKEYERPVKGAPTLVDSSTLPDLSTHKPEPEQKSTIEMASFGSGANPEDVIVVFSPSGSLEKPASPEVAAVQAEVPTVAEEEKTPEVKPASATVILGSEITEDIPFSASGVEPDVSHINARSKGANTTILQEEIEVEEEVALRREKPTTRFDGAPFEFELETSDSPLPIEGYPARPDEPLSDVLARAKPHSPTSQLGAKAPDENEPLVSTGPEELFVIEPRVIASTDSHPGAAETMAIEPPIIFTADIEPRVAEPIVERAFQEAPTVPIGEDPLATQVMHSQPTAPTREVQPLPETKVNLNEAALQAFGIGPKTPPPTTAPPPPTATFPPPPQTRTPAQPPGRMQDFSVPIVMPIPTPAPARRSIASMVSIVVGLLVVVATVFVLWWYAIGGGQFTNRGKGTISPPELPQNNTETPTTTPTIATPTAPPGMAMVPAGTYTIGRDLDDERDQPAHKVDLKAFFIDLTEVTNAQYKAFVDAKSHRQPDGWERGTYPEGRANWPVTGVSWDDAVKYAEWAGKRLPTEAEWEAAARGAEARTYPWGNAWGEGLANIRGNSITEVGQFKLGASPFGALDMIGNVWEWTADTFTLYPGSPASMEKLIEQKLIEPGVTYRIIRGGAFDRKDNINASLRGYVDASKGYDKTGFRCVKDVN